MWNTQSMGGGQGDIESLHTSYHQTAAEVPGASTRYQHRRDKRQHQLSKAQGIGDAALHDLKRLRCASAVATIAATAPSADAGIARIAFTLLTVATPRQARYHTILQQQLPLKTLVLIVIWYYGR